MVADRSVVFSRLDISYSCVVVVVKSSGDSRILSNVVKSSKWCQVSVAGVISRWQVCSHVLAVLSQWCRCCRDYDMT